MSGSKKGRVVSDATREKMRVARLGRKQSEETKEKIRQKMLDNGNGERTRFGAPGWKPWNVGTTEMVAGKCEKCGTEFSRPKSRKDQKRFCSQACAYQSRSGEQHGNWKGGRSLLRVGYWRVRDTETRKYRYEHINIVEKILGRPMRKGEIVHHINGDKQDNHPRNLLVCTNDYHRSLHGEMSRRYAREHFPSYRKE